MSEAVPNFVNGVEVGRYSQIGGATPDHAIRNKRTPLVVPAPEVGQGKAFREEAGKAAEKYVADYRAYFARNDGVREPPRKSMDPMPRVVMVPGLGLFGVATARLFATEGGRGSGAGPGWWQSRGSGGGDHWA